MLSTSRIIDQRMLSMNRRRGAVRASVEASVAAPIGMSAMSPPACRCSEPRNIRKRELARMDMHAAELRAAVQCRKHFSRIEQALRVKRAFQALLLVEVDLVEHIAHEIALLDADAVLAGEHAAELDAGAQDVG